MMPSLWSPIRHVLRLTVEARTPLSVSSGETIADIDVALFRDWNGLPCLSGASLAGVLRALHEDYFGADETASLFGYETSRKTDQGQASRLIISFGYVHDKNDRSVEEWRSPKEIAADTLLSLLAEDAPLLRDHVAISHRGAARANLKFDRSSCPTGTRFSLELGLDGDEAEDAQEQDKKALQQVASLIEAPYARFGGAGRRGLGRLGIVRATYCKIDRRGDSGREAWIAYRKLAIDEAPSASTVVTLSAPPAVQSQRRPLTGKLRLQARSFWRLGQGSAPWTSANLEKAADLVPPREPIIRWDANGGHITDKPLASMPGAGVKGAIAHRVEFHLRRLEGPFVKDSTPIDDLPLEDVPPRRADRLFGTMRGKESGFAGAVMMDDMYIDFENQSPATSVRTRNSIDRHTGGVRLQKLFSDEAFWRGPAVVIPITVLTRVPSGQTNDLRELDQNVVKALSWALEDLCNGTLALGGRESAGDGTFDGCIIWSSENDSDLCAAVDALNADSVQATSQRQVQL